MGDQELTLRMDAAGRTDVGQARRAAGLPDEDTVFLARFRDVADAKGVRALYAVADGVSQRKGGKVASAQAINMLEEAIEYYARRGESGIPGIDTLDSFLEYVLVRIDETLKSFAENNESIAGMGSTVTAAVIVGNMAKIVHAGDSRAYLFSAGSGARRLTQDDVTTDESGESVPDSGVGCITDAPRISRSNVELREGDVLLLCTDGLWREVSDQEIEHIVRESMTPAVAVDRLIRTANEHGGSGNVAAVVCYLGEPMVAKAAPAEPVTASAPAVVAEPEKVRALGEAEVAAASVGPAALPQRRPPAVERHSAPLPDVRDRVAEASGPLVAFLFGVTVTIAAVLVVWGVGWAVSRALAHRSGSLAKAELATVPLWCWFERDNPQPDRCAIEVAKYNQAGEQVWEPVSPGERTEVGAAKEQVGGRTVYDVFFRVRLNEEPQSDPPKPLATRFRLKVNENPKKKPQQVAGRGVIVVTHNAPAKATVTPVDGGEPIQQDLKEVPGQGYRAEFRYLEYGNYKVQGARRTYESVAVSEAMPRVVLRLSAHETPTVGLTETP